MDQRADIVDALRDVYDPCCEDRGLSVVDMGLIEDIRVEEGRASVDLVLTSGWCPFMVPLVETIRERVAAVATVADADVRVVWDTAWTSVRLSSVARKRLQFLPPPNQIAGAEPVAATAVPAPAHTTSEVTP
jgi:metal-sulfur cluster biosynthetic enzyme